MTREARRESWRLAWPLILSNLSVPLLGVVGHLEAPHYLGAVALGATLVSVLYFLFGFLRMGTTALTAQALGAGDALALRAGLVRAFLAAACLGLLLLALGPWIAGLSEHLFAPTAEIAAEYRQFVALRLLGAPAALASYVVLGWLLGLQDARRPLYVMLATHGLNVVLAVTLV